MTDFLPLDFRFLFAYIRGLGREITWGSADGEWGMFIDDMARSSCCPDQITLGGAASVEAARGGVGGVSW